MAAACVEAAESSSWLLRSKGRVREYVNGSESSSAVTEVGWSGAGRRISRRVGRGVVKGKRASRRVSGRVRMNMRVSECD